MPPSLPLNGLLLHICCLSEGNAVHLEESMCSKRWDVEDYNKFHFDVVQVKAKHLWFQMQFTFPYHKTHVTYSVNVYNHSDVQLDDIIPWVVLNRMICLLWREIAAEHTPECAHDSFLCAPKFGSVSVRSYFITHVGNRTSFQMMPTWPRMWFIMGRFWIA